MQGEVSDRSRGKKRRIHSIATLDKSSINLGRLTPMPKSKEMKSFYLQNESCVESQYRERESRVVGIMDRLQQEIDLAISTLQVKENKQKYLEMKLHQILTKQDENIIRLKSKLHQLTASFNQKDQLTQKLRTQLDSIIHSQTDYQTPYPRIVESKYSIADETSRYKSSTKPTRRYQEETIQKGYRKVKMSLSPFSSQPINDSY